MCDYINSVNHSIGFLHDVGYLLMETRYNERNNKKRKEKEAKLVDIFINKIQHNTGLTGMNLLLSPFTMLLNHRYLRKFLSIHGPQVNKIIMTDSHVKYHTKNSKVNASSLQKIIDVLGTNTFNVTELRISQSPYKYSSLTNLKALYESRMSQTLTVLNLCHVNFSYCSMKEIRRCMTAMINLRELRIVQARMKRRRGHIIDNHRHPFTLPIPDMERQPLIRNYFHRKRKSDGSQKVYVHYNNSQHIQPNYPFKLEILVFSEQRSSSFACTSKFCPQIQEFKSLFMYYPKLKVLDLTNVNLKTMSLKYILSNKNKKISLTPVNNEQIELISKYLREKDEKNDHEEDENGYHHHMKYVRDSKCTKCVLDNNILRGLAEIIVRDETDEKQLRITTDQRVERMDAVLRLMMDYVLRHCSIMKVYDQVLFSMRSIIVRSSQSTLLRRVPCMEEISVWLSQIASLLVLHVCPGVERNYIRGIIEEIQCNIQLAS